jgi:hypothetical protein
MIGPVGLTSLSAPGMVTISIPPCLGVPDVTDDSFGDILTEGSRKVYVYGRGRTMVLEAFAVCPSRKLFLPLHQPGRFEYVESVALQLSGKQRCDSAVAAQNHKITRPADMNDQSVRDFGTLQTASIRGVDPSAAGVDHSPDQKSFTRVPPDADQRAIKGCRGTEPANLVLAQFPFVD